MCVNLDNNTMYIISVADAVTFSSGPAIQRIRIHEEVENHNSGQSSLMDDDLLVLLVEETGVPGENHRPCRKSLTNFIT
jgi:hypothetical protein